MPSQATSPDRIGPGPFPECVTWADDSVRAAAQLGIKRLSFLSHDLHNNLNAISLHLKLLRQRLATSGNFGEELSMLDRAEQSIGYTTDGMRRLLSYERLRRHPPCPELRPLDLHNFLGHVAAQHALQANAKGLELSVDVPRGALVNSDAQLIVLVLQNLVSNAVKYSSRGVVGISARRQAAIPDAYWVISVSDHGPGIPPHLLARIFDEFQRGDAAEEDGVGLGLAIASEAAELLGAELSVESEMGVGSTFNLALHPICLDTGPGVVPAAVGAPAEGGTLRPLPWHRPGFTGRFPINRKE